MKRKLSWEKSKKKFVFKKIAHFGDEAPLPPSVDLRPFCPPVLDQGELGSCTANALAHLWGFLELKAMREKVQDAEEFDPSKFVSPSRLFLYYQERSIEGDISDDNGADAYDGVQSLINVGCCDETVWPYDIDQFDTEPSADAYAQAADHKISDYAELKDLDGMRRCLFNGLPFTFGIDTFKNFEDLSEDFIMPSPEGKREGGHQMCVVGYDDTKGDHGCFIILNSWGPNYGQGGTFYIEYDDFLNNSAEWLVLTK